jgi:Sortase domain
MAALLRPGVFRVISSSSESGSQVLHEGAPSPGQPGVAVIAGQVDSVAGPGVLFYLKDLTVGDSIQVTDSRGRTSTWTVDAPPQASLKTGLPPALRVTTGPPTLALVTCGGPFDTATGHYRDNVIVWARQAGLRRGIHAEAIDGLTLRSRDEVAGLVAGLELVPPGLVHACE